MKTETITHANHEWSTRPADERFSSLEELYAAVLARHQGTTTTEIPSGTLTVYQDHTGLVVGGATSGAAKLTNWSFGQICHAAEAPATYLASLSPMLAAQALNEGLRRHEPYSTGAVVYYDRATHQARSVVSQRYVYIPDAEVVRQVMEYTSGGPWQPLPAAYDGARGLYAGDRDCFIGLVDNDRRIFERNGNGGLSRGVLLWNSEVRARSFGGVRFLYNYVCGNHIFWGTEQVQEFSVRHLGRGARDRAQSELSEALMPALGSGADDEQRIGRALRYEIGPDRKGVVDRVYALRSPVLTRGVLEAAYDAAEQHTDWYGSPRAAWGFAQGITEVSQGQQHADTRTALDRAAGRVLALAA